MLCVGLASRVLVNLQRERFSPLRSDPRAQTAPNGGVGEVNLFLEARACEPEVRAHVWRVCRSWFWRSRVLVNLQRERGPVD